MPTEPEEKVVVFTSQNDTEYHRFSDAVCNRWTIFQRTHVIRIMPNRGVYTDPGPFDLLMVWEPADQYNDYRQLLNQLKETLQNHTNNWQGRVYVVLHETAREQLKGDQQDFVATLFPGQLLTPPVKYKHEPTNVTYSLIAEVLKAASGEERTHYTDAWSRLITWLDRPRRFDAAANLLLPLLYQHICAEFEKPVTTDLDVEAVKKAYASFVSVAMPKDVENAITDMCRTTENYQAHLKTLSRHLNQLVHEHK